MSDPIFDEVKFEDALTFDHEPSLEEIEEALEAQGFI